MGFYIQDDFWEAAQVLPERDQDRLMGALVRLFYTGKESVLTGVSLALFVAFKQRVLIARKRSDAGKSKGQSNQESNQESNGVSNHGSKRESKPDQMANQNDNQNGIKPIKSESESESKGESDSENGISSSPESSNSSNSSKPKRGRGGFSPPTPEEVETYALEAGLTIDSERFCDYYSAQGWKLSNGNAMRDWRSAVRNWTRNSKPRGGEQHASTVQLGTWGEAF